MPGLRATITAGRPTITATVTKVGPPMLRSLRLRNFKNFADERLTLGPFSVIVGANASGKSNLRDAFRFLHGIGRGYRLSEILGGKYGAGGQLEWAAMRGAMNEIARFGSPSFSLEAEIRTRVNDRDHDAKYHIEAAPAADSGDGFHIEREELRFDGEVIYTTHPENADDPNYRDSGSRALLVRLAKTGTQRKLGARIGVDPGRPVLSQIAEQTGATRLHKDPARAVLSALSRMRFLDLVPERMREPSFPGHTVLGDHGENLATVLKRLCMKDGRKEALTDWIGELTPMDVGDLEFPADPATGKVRLVLRERDGSAVSAASASDGTLRFLALLASLLGDAGDAILVLEEVEGGIHPARLRLLIELIEHCTGTCGVQAITTTQSPTMLSLIGDRAFETASLVCRLPESSDAVIRPVRDLPNAGELRRSQGLGRLLASGWMEDAVAFTEFDRPAIPLESLGA